MSVWNYRVGETLRYRQRLQRAIGRWIDHPLLEKDFQLFATEVRKALPKKVPFVPVYESLESLAGSKLAAEDVDDVAWRLAGNLDVLRRHAAVPIWLGQKSPEWVPVQIRGGCRSMRKEERGFFFEFRILSGTPAGRLVSQFWSVKFCRFLSRRIGFTPASGYYPFRDGLELVNLRLDVLMSTEKSTLALPAFGQVLREEKLSGALLAHNRRLLRSRARVDPGYVCPFEFPRHYFCYLCSVGLDQCGAAVHAVTYEERDCKSCGVASAPFNGAAEQCVNCEREKAWSKDAQNL